MTSSDPEVIRRQIEDTRRELSYDVDALNEKVNPSRVVDRRVSNVKGRVVRAKDRVMGGGSTRTSQTHRTAQKAMGSGQSAASHATGPGQKAPAQPAGPGQKAARTPPGAGQEGP